MSEVKPTGFSDLGVKELRRSAVEDFAVDIKRDDNKDTVIAAIAESGVTWADYVAQHPEVAPEPVRESEPDRGNVITSADAKGEEPEVIIRTAEAPVVAPTEKFLVKMVRDNVRYDTRGYTFSQEHPYALVSGEDLEHILSKEVGFRQALPSELADYYDRK